MVNYLPREFIYESGEYKSFPDRRIKRDNLNEQLLNSLNKYVPDFEVTHILELLKKGANPNTVDSSGNRPIHLAIKNSPQNFKLFLKISERGADLNVVNKYGCTPLMFSVGRKCYKTTEKLIKKGVNINFQCQQGWTALMLASMNGHLWSVRILLEHGANADLYDEKRKTALWFAVEGKYRNVIRELLEYGANPAICDAARSTVLCAHLRDSHPKLYIINELILHCASFMYLESNVQASFLKVMKICLEKKPTFRACVRTVIKIRMLLTEDHSCVSQFSEWYDFANKCRWDIKSMKCFSVSNYSSVARLLVRSLGGVMPKERELEALLPFVANNYFPVYADILEARLTKPFLREKFKNLFISAKKEGKNNVFLNYDLNEKIMSFLSDDDVKNCVLAAYVKTNSHEEIKMAHIWCNGLR